MADETKDQAKKMIDEACKAYGIDPKYVFASNYHPDKGEAVLLTQGGKKVRWKKGQEVKPLDVISITGINPKWKDRKPIAGKAK